MGFGFDKAKALRAAEKYLAQNKISSAIQEYCRIVENDEDDFNALNTLGDLYARADRKAEALSCFKRVAEHYQQQGFALKAIAVYKKITRLESATPEVASALALLYEQQGLIVDARAQYLQVADFYARDGQTREALDVLQRVANLDPNNIPIRLRLAESFLAEGLNDLAAEAFTEAGERLLARGAHDKALEVFNKAVTWRPHSLAALQGLLATHAALGTADEAAEALERAAAGRPGDLELRALVVNAHIEAENAQAAEQSVRELVRRDPASFPLFFDVARLHLQQGGIDDAVRVLAQVAEAALTARKEDALLNLLQEALARDPEQVGALRLLVRVYEWQRDHDNLRNALENLAETAETLGLEDEEREALAQLVRLAPLEFRFRERLEALGGSVGDAFAQQQQAAPESGPSQGAGEVPTFESFMVPDAPFAAASASGAGSPGASQAPDASAFEWNTVEPPAESYRADSSASFADLNEGLTDSAGATFDFSGPGGAQTGGRAHADAYTASVLAQELESVDFYLKEGYTDIARDTLDMLERQYGPHPSIKERRRSLPAAEAGRPAAEFSPADFSAPPDANFAEPSAAAFAPETSESVEFSFQMDAGAPPASAEPDITFDAASAATGFDFTINTAEPAADEPPTFETASVEPTAFETPAFGATGAQTSTFEISNVGTPGVEPPAPPPATQAVTQAPPPRTQTPPTVQPAPPQPAAIDPGLAAIFEEFREEEEPASDDGDFETHYNMGLAYKEMDLFDQAVEEFQNAAGMVAPGDGTPRYLNCCNLLGHCFMRKGVPRAAAIWFRKGLDAPGHTEDEYQALRYELATAYEQMGELAKAIDTFTEVYGIDVSYRGVADKLRELQAQRAALKQ